ncbi:MAG: fused MFS/spermidine synthase [Myxococcales bacterium]
MRWRARSWAKLWLIERLGLTEAAAAAALLNLLAGLSAMVLSRRFPGSAPVAPAALADPAPARPLGRARRLLVATALAGGLMLALEVVWFRFQLLYFRGTSLNFAAMLAVVLSGVGLGGLLGGAVLKHRPQAARHAAAVAVAAGALVALLFGTYDLVPLPVSRDFALGLSTAVARSSWLMLLPATLSGALFTFVGELAAAELGEAARTTGMLALFNTFGAAAGSALAGLVLLPLLGMERSLFLLALGYGAVAALCASWASRRALAVAGLCWLVALASFPFGCVRERHLPRLVERFASGGPTRIVATTEGLSETLTYLQTSFAGEPGSLRLVTNGHSMSGTALDARRYMKHFVYLPMALRPQAKKALLVCFGVGATARALVDTPWLEQVDIVDLSPEILRNAELIYAPGSPLGPSPLSSPKARVHVEDGRFFLQASTERYDLVTAEPPPPINAGMAALYSREHFEAIRSRLAEGGLVTYWLPVYQMQPEAAKAITRAFCDVFEDCSLWTGRRYEWTLLGTRGTKAPAEQDFLRQWAEPAVRPELTALGFELPEQLGATFLADAPALAEFTRGVEPLTDLHPGRLVPGRPNDESELAPELVAMMDAERARTRFAQSELIARLWPTRLREASQPWFAVQGTMNDVLASAPLERRLQRLDALLRTTELRELPAWLLGLHADRRVLLARRLARGPGDAETAFYQGAFALADRDFAGAAKLLGEAANATPEVEFARELRAYALFRSGEVEAARAELAAIRSGKGEPAVADELAALLGP